MLINSDFSDAMKYQNAMYGMATAREQGRYLRYTGLPYPKTQTGCYRILEELDHRLERAENMSRGPVGYTGPMECIIRKESPPSIPYSSPITAPTDTQRLLLV